MGKVATNIDEQIDLLESRGMLLGDREKAREYLLDIGYYRLGFYWHYFESDDQHNFVENTKLETIRKLYYFDFDLKYLLSKYIYRIEVHFRTQLVYLVSNKYKDTPTWFVDKKVVSEDMIKFIDKLYNGNEEAFKRNNKPIKNHHAKYINDKYAPAWKTLEFFTFGQINKLFRSLKDDNLKREIAKSYGYLDVASFQNHITAIVNIRNICSHNGILFDYNQPIGVKKIPNELYRIKSRNQTNLNASISVVFNILSTISQNRVNDLKKQLDNLIAENMAIPELCKNIETKIGYEII